MRPELGESHPLMGNAFNQCIASIDEHFAEGLMLNFMPLRRCRFREA
jgi:hypothetical protein